MDKKETDIKKQILWYFEKIVCYLSETQDKAILTMLKRFYTQIGKRG